MNIKRFLSTGTSHVHTKEPGGNFAKSAAAILLGLAVGASSLFAINQTVNGLSDRSSSVAEMPYAADGVSSLYQALVSPERDSGIRIVSTRSSSLSAMLDSMPRSFAINNTVSTQDIAEYSSRGVSISMVAKAGINKKESICIVSAIDAVDDSIKERNGFDYVNISVNDDGLIDELSVVAGNMSPEESRLLHTIHELSHCQSRFKSERAMPPANDDIQKVFNKSFDEAGADLSVILYYASKEGSFENGLLAISALRGQFNNADHSTLGMLELILEKLSAPDFFGMKTSDVFSLTTDIMDEAWGDSELNGQLKSAFLRDYYEGAVLGAMVSGNTLQLDELSGRVLEAFRKTDPAFNYDISAKAAKMIERALGHGLRNPDLHRGLGQITVKGMESLASKMGVQLSGQQLLKARFLDPEFTPVGFKGGVGIAGTELLREVNHFAELEARAALSAGSGAMSLPRFN